MRPALPGAEVIDDTILGDLEQPRGEQASAREVRKALIDAEEDLLGQILGRAAIADETEDVRQERRLIGLDEPAERPLVTAGGCCEDPCVKESGTT